MSEQLGFARLVLENWKNFVRVDAPLRRRVFIVGANASGKSNFLDAFRFLRDLASPGGGLRESVRKRGGVSSLRCLAARRYPDITIRATLRAENGPTWIYEITFNQDNLRRPLVRKEHVEKEGTVLCSRPDEQDQKDPERLTQTYLEQVNMNRDFRELVSFFQSVRYLHIVPQLVREPDRSVGRVNDPYGGDFLETIAKATDRTQKARFRRIQEALRVAVPQLQEIELTRDAKGVPHLRGRYEHWRPHGAWQSEEQFSDGTLRLMGLLWALMEGAGPLLLEEPELSLHPEIIRYLPQMFARLQRRTGRQILLSTHSPELLRDDGIAADEVLLLRPSREGTEVILGADLKEINTLLNQGLSLADAVMPRTRPEKVEQLMLFGD